MKTPNNAAGKLTEKIMFEIGPYVTNYNKVYSIIYKVLRTKNNA